MVSYVLLSLCSYLEESKWKYPVLWSSVEMQTSTMSEQKGMLGGNMTCDRPLRELTGVPDDREEPEELDSEPWEEDFWVPLDTEEENERLSN